MVIMVIQHLKMVKINFMLCVLPQLKINKISTTVIYFAHKPTVWAVLHGGGSALLRGVSVVAATTPGRSTSMTAYSHAWQMGAATG